MDSKPSSATDLPLTAACQLDIEAMQLLDFQPPGSHNLQGYVTLVMVVPKCDSRSAARTVIAPAVMNAF